MADDSQIIHVTFAPDGTVRGIGARPPAATPQAWFDHLTRRAGARYQALAGGRGLFRLAPGEIAELQAVAAE